MAVKFWKENSKRSTSLTKVQAQELINELIDDGINPDRLRVVVDGTV